MSGDWSAVILENSVPTSPRSPESGSSRLELSRLGALFLMLEVVVSR